MKMNTSSKICQNLSNACMRKKWRGSIQSVAVTIIETLFRQTKASFPNVAHVPSGILQTFFLLIYHFLECLCDLPLVRTVGLWTQPEIFFEKTQSTRARGACRFDSYIERIPIKHGQYMVMHKTFRTLSYEKMGWLNTDKRFSCTRKDFLNSLQYNISHAFVRKHNCQSIEYGSYTKALTALAYERYSMKTLLRCGTLITTKTQIVFAFGTTFVKFLSVWPPAEQMSSELNLQQFRCGVETTLTWRVLCIRTKLMTVIRSQRQQFSLDEIKEIYLLLRLRNTDMVF